MNYTLERILNNSKSELLVEGRNLYRFFPYALGAFDPHYARCRNPLHGENS
jgi:chromosome condensin MukBEF complex kleisin-like MukF subunit